jgi:hypothetical protein
MKKLRLIVLLLIAGLLHAENIVLYDAAVTPIASVQQHSKSSFQVKNGVLEITTKGNTGYPGIVLKGNWDLSKCNRLTVEMVNRDNKGHLPITVRLDNPGANAGKSKGVFVDRVRILGKTPKVYSMALPPLISHGQEINSKLFGMRKGPLNTSGVVCDLDPSKVVAVALYIKQPQLNWRWGVKRIVAHVGNVKKTPAWMDMTAEEFFPFIDVYGQFKYKDWPGKIHNDAELQQARIREEADLKAHPGPKNWSKFGGWANGPKRQATGHFRVETIDGKWWMVDPEGFLYWSHGPVRVTPSTAMTPLDKRDMYFTDLPKAGTTFAKFYTTRDELLHPYYVKRDIKRTYDFSSANCYRKYGERYYEIFAELAHRRLRSWGMNTIANSSDKKICIMDRTT